MTQQQNNNNTLKNKKLFQFSGFATASFQVDNIILYNKNGIICQLDPKYINLQQKNYKKENYYNKTGIYGLFLNNLPIKKIKPNFNIKDNYYIKRKNKYYDEYDLYINIDQENIKIEQLPDSKKEMRYKYYYHYKNYKITGLYCLYSHLAKFTATEEESKKIKNFYKSMYNDNVKNINDEIEKEKTLINEFKNSNREYIYKKHLDFLEAEKQKNKKYVVFKYVKAVSSTIEHEQYTHSTTDSEADLLKENIKTLKNLLTGYYEKDILNNFKKLNIDLESINLKDLINQ